MNDMASALDQPMKQGSDFTGTIEYKLNELEKQQGAILDGLDALSGKIGPVLRLEVEAPTSQPTAGRDPEQGRIANRLDDLLEYNQRAIRAIQNLIGRVEL